MRMLVVIQDPRELSRIHGVHSQTAVLGAVLAVCLVHESTDRGTDHLALQRQLTATLRSKLGAAAESIAIFVVTGRHDDDVGRCAAEWGATSIADIEGREWQAPGSSGSPP